MVRRGSQDWAAAQPRGEGPPLLRRPRWCIRPRCLPHVRSPPSPHALFLLDSRLLKPNNLIAASSGTATLKKTTAKAVCALLVMLMVDMDNCSLHYNMLDIAMLKHNLLSNCLENKCA